MAITLFICLRGLRACGKCTKFRLVPENLGTESDTEMSFWGYSVYIIIPRKVGSAETEPRKRTSAFGHIIRARNLARSPKNFSDTETR